MTDVQPPPSFCPSDDGPCPSAEWEEVSQVDIDGLREFGICLYLKNSAADQHVMR